MEKKKPYMYQRTSCYDKRDKKTLDEMEKFSKWYIDFLKTAKTERLSVRKWVEMLEKNWFVDIAKFKWTPKPWQKIYFNYREKNLFAVVFGKKSLDTWIRTICSHVDSPRIDFKYMPFFDSDGLCLMKTHYYGGIKKYQRVAMPLSIIGTIYDKNWKKLDINIWEDEKDPVFFLSDLLPHLWADQMAKKASKVVEWEEMNLLVWSKFSPKQKENVKENILKLVYEKYGITEEWFVWAELEIVPCLHPREVWFDRSMIGWYGQDDRICAYASMKSLLDSKTTPEQTSIIYRTDKEEIWSTGATWSQSNVFTYVIEKLYALYQKNFNVLDIDNVLHNSLAISSDVTVLLDPNFKWAHDASNTAIINHGVVLEKFTWSWWKYSANDADIEYIHKLKRHFDKNNIIYQFGWMWKIDLWWWGTISKYLAHLWMDIVDMWPGLLNMHAPFEVSGKADIYAAYLAYKIFWNM